jgi:hypothetical protein
MGEKRLLVKAGKKSLTPRLREKELEIPNR